MIAQWARQRIRVVRRWQPPAAITVLGDQAYRVVCPLRLDAVLQDAPP